MEPGQVQHPRCGSGPVVSGPVRRAVLFLLFCLLAVACSSTSDADKATEQRLAEQLVAATEKAGVAPRLTTDAAESLYGTDASSVCDAFDGGASTAADLIMRGNLAQGRRKVITDEAVIYTGLVVETYCPDLLIHLEDVVKDLDPFEKTS
jgi:hypothetical protein